MQIFRHPTHLDDDCRGSVAALGNFDGFHRGHQAVIGEAGRIARATSRPLAVFTTEPHPRSFFSDDGDRFRLTPFRERANLFEGFGVDLLFVLPFDKALSETAADIFVTDILARDLGISHAVIGYDYRFGKGRQGDAALLREVGEGCGVAVSVVEPISVGVEGAAGEIYSSTLVRDALRAGEARRAAALLGHWWTVNGHIIEGDKRGRTIGFPTANMTLQESLVPAHGVYAVRVALEGGSDGAMLEGVANVGRRPTFGSAGVLLEAHLFDFDEDIYGQHQGVELVGFIRRERKFDGIDSLKEQIAIDCEVAKRILADPENARSRFNPPTLDRYLEMFPEAQGVG
jgi:riboflavin kinase/FMN adenylyltransferase